MDLDDQQFAFAKWKTMVKQKGAGFVWIVDYDPDNRTVSRIQDRQGEHMNSMGPKDADKVVQTSEPIRCEDRELDYGIGISRKRRLCRHHVY